MRTIHAQLTAIFNHAVNFYNLSYNPARRAGTIGSEAVKEMDFWTKEEYLKFSEAMMDKPRSYYAFEMLYWCGMRSGELLALTPADIDFEKQTVTISKTFHRSKGRDIITSPKTKKSNRTIKMPPFLCEEMQEYIKMLYDIKPDERLFTVTKSYLNHEMERGAKQAGVKKIRVHDIRHSAVSLLINMGFSVLAIGERMGHEAEKITYRYAHLFPTVQTEMARNWKWTENDKGGNPPAPQGQSIFCGKQGGLGTWQKNHWITKEDGAIIRWRSGYLMKKQSVNDLWRCRGLLSRIIITRTALMPGRCGCRVIEGVIRH